MYEPLLRFSDSCCLRNGSNGASDEERNNTQGLDARPYQNQKTSDANFFRKGDTIIDIFHNDSIFLMCIILAAQFFEKSLQQVFKIRFSPLLRHSNITYVQN